MQLLDPARTGIWSENLVEMNPFFIARILLRRAMLQPAVRPRKFRLPLPSRSAHEILVRRCTEAVWATVEVPSKLEMQSPTSDSLGPCQAVGPFFRAYPGQPGHSEVSQRTCKPHHAMAL